MASDQCGADCLMDNCYYTHWIISPKLNQAIMSFRIETVEMTNKYEYFANWLIVLIIFCFQVFNLYYKTNEN